VGFDLKDKKEGEKFQKVKKRKEGSIRIRRLNGEAVSKYHHWKYGS